jgi:hypothetical protein
MQNSNPETPLLVLLIGGFGHAVWVFDEWRRDAAPVCLAGAVQLAPDEPLDLFLAHDWARSFTPSVFQDVQQALDAVKPDLVVVSTRPDRNPAVIEQCLRAGCHVIAEKPLAVDEAGLLRLHRAVQKKGTLIVCRMSYPDFSVQAGDMLVFFSDDLKRTEEGPFVFVEAENAYAAVRIASYTQKTWDNNNWMRMKESMFPLVFEVAMKSDYPDFEAFKAAVKACSYKIKDSVLYYSGLGGTGDFTFYYALSRLPEIDGKPIDLKPDFTFKSPFMFESWASGKVEIKKDKREYLIHAAQ